MKTRYIEFNKYGASLDTSSREGFSIKTASGRTIGVLKYSPDPSAFTSDDPATIPLTSRLAQNALNSLLALEDQILRANRDERWSVEGRRQNLAPARLDAIKTLIAVDRELREHEQTIAAQQAAFFAVPQLSAGDVVGYLRDQEIRNSLRALGAETDVMKLLKGDAAAGLLPDPALILAILRSPVKSARLETVANEIWRGLAQERDPVLYETFAIIERAIEWCQMVLGIVLGIVKRELLGFAGKDLFDIVYPLGGAELFGFLPAQIAQFKRAAA